MIGGAPEILGANLRIAIGAREAVMPASLWRQARREGRYHMLGANLKGCLIVATALSAIGVTATRDASAQEIEEIIVTATRRAESLQEVPIAIAVYSTELLHNAGVDDIQELMNLSPSFQASSNVSESQGLVIRIRGVGTQGNNPAFESAVGVFIDGVYRARAGIALTELLDIEQIEVLRGPQGTLFGRNTTAGALNIITRGPSLEPEATLEATYGNFNEFDIRGTISGPIIADKLAARVSAQFLRRDGFVTDFLTGADLDNKNRYQLKGQVLFTPNDRTDLRLIFDIRESNEDCCFPVTLNNDRDIRPSDIINGVPNAGNFPPPSIPIPPFPPLGTQVDPPNAFARQATSNSPTTQDVKEFGFSGELNVEFDKFNFTSITAYRDFESFRELDVDFTDADLLFNDRVDSTEIFTQEVRLQGVTGKLDWLVGAFYSDEQIGLRGSLTHGTDYLSFIDQRLGNLVLALFSEGQPLAGLVDAVGGSQFTFSGTDLFLAGFSPFTALAATGGAAPGGWAGGTGAIDDQFSSDNTSFSIFTHNVFSVTEELKLTLGFRYNWDDKHAVSVINNDPANSPGCIGIRPALQFLPNNIIMETLGLTGDLRRVKDVIAALGCLGITSPGFSFDIKQSTNEWSGTAGLSYQVSEDVMVYGSFGRGYKAGGINLDRAGTTLTLVGDNTDPANFLSPVFGPEIVNAFEIGLKTSFPDSRTTINIAVYLNDYDNFQLNTFTGFNFQPESIEKVQSKGFEIELTTAPTDNLQAQFGVAYTKADYGDNITDTSNRLVNERGLRAGIAPFPVVLLPELSSLAGQQLTNAPRWVATGALTWSKAAFRGGAIEVFLHGDFRYSSSFNTGSDLDIEKLQKSFFLVNARGGIRLADGGWQIDLWAKNIFNKDYHQVAFDIPLQANATFGTFLADPRTFGVGVRTHF